MNLEWKIDALDCYPEKGGQTDVVFTAHWRVNAQDGQLSSTAYGSVSLQPPPPGSPFTPFAELRREQVVGWVQEALGQEQVQKIEAGVVKSLEDQRNPPVVTPPLPWAG